MDLTVLNNNNDNLLLRDYRKGNWTLQETMVLIEAKKMDDVRRMKRTGDGTERGKPAELRWKWVEDYCWKNGCLRSQNQCNDKWDNLMRDFKKVREYENRVAAAVAAERLSEDKSYWKIEKTERKDQHLPSNMLFQIYEALVEVVEKKTQIPATPPPSMVAVPGSSKAVTAVATVANVQQQQQQQPSVSHVLSRHYHPIPPHAQQHQPIVHTAAPAALPPIPPAEPPNLPYSQPLPSVDSDTSDYSDSQAKRKKKRGNGGNASGEGTSGGGGGGALQEVGMAITKSASIIAEAIQSCEEREERRHKEMLRLHERRLQIEESKVEISRQGINGIMESINKLANSIIALASHKNQPSSK